MKSFDPARAALGVATGLALLSGCSGSPATAPLGGAAGSQPAGHAAHPLVFASGKPWARAGVATPKQSRIVRGAATVLVTQSFANASTKGWYWKDSACLTAGTTPVKASIPPCGANAPQDPPGSGALQFTQPASYMIGFAGYGKPLPTANGLDVQFTLYSFGGSTPGADGTLLYFADGSQKRPGKPGADGGDLGYIESTAHGLKGIANAYLGVGFDEYGNFSGFLPGGPGQIPESVALGGAESIGYEYLGGVTNGSGIPVSLPFDLDDPSSPTRPANAPTIDVSLTPAGLLEVAIDIHNGQGPVVYLSETVAGVAGEPAVPATLFVGFAGTTGGSYNRHQIGSVTISTLD